MQVSVVECLGPYLCYLEVVQPFFLGESLCRLEEFLPLLLLLEVEGEVEAVGVLVLLRSLWRLACLQLVFQGCLLHFLLQ